MRYLFEHYLHEDEETSEKRHITRCSIFDRELKYLWAEGIAICCPTDQYSRKLGNRIARGRAEKALRTGKSSSRVNPSRNHCVFKEANELHEIYKVYCSASRVI